MSLTGGRGPLGTDPAGSFNMAMPSGVMYVEPYHRRIRAELGDKVVVESERVMLVHRPATPPTLAFPTADVGEVTSQRIDGLPGHVAVPWDAVDTWFEEGQVMQGHPRNPYHRVDCLHTDRRLQVSVAGVELVDTNDTVILFETSLVPKLYVAKDQVRMDLLRRSDTTTYCAYKGTATWWSADVDGTVVEDVAWSYEDAYPESQVIEGLLSFDLTRADVVADVPVEDKPWVPLCDC